jgi:chromate transporter
VSSREYQVPGTQYSPIAVTTQATPASGLSIRTIAHEWGRIGCIGFGGPPAHIALLRQLCVERRRWLEPREFEDAIAACNLLPGPASTQLAIFCAWRLRGRVGALVGGACFIVPGLILILALSAIFLASSPPTWVRGAGLGTAIPLTRALAESWQYAVLAAAAVLLLVLRRGVVSTLLLAAAAGIVIGVAGGPLPG